MKKQEEHWYLKAYTDAGEATIGWSSRTPLKQPLPRPKLMPDLDLSPEVPRTGACLARSAQQAQAAVRRFATSNAITSVWTPTYTARTDDVAGVVSDMARFIRRLRRETGGFEWLWALEMHPLGHGLHAHFATGREIPYDIAQAAWPYGFVEPPDSEFRDPRGPIEAARRLTRYLLKAPIRLPGAGRYHRSRGRTPQLLRWFPTEEMTKAAARELFGGPPVWSNEASDPNSRVLVQYWDTPAVLI